VVRSAWGAPSHNPASRFLDELPVDLVEWKRTAAEQTSWGRPAASYGDGGYGGNGNLTGRGRQQMASRFSSATASADASKKAMAGREIPNLVPGDRVNHDTFGLGTVVTVEGAADKAVASIDFGTDGVKRLLLRYAPVEKL